MESKRWSTSRSLKLGILGSYDSLAVSIHSPRISLSRRLFLLNKKNPEIQHVNETMGLLKLVSYFFAVLYFFLTVGHFFLLQDSFKWILFTAALLTAIVNVAIGFNASKFSLPQQNSIILLLLLMASSNSQLHLWLSAAPEQTTNIFVTIIASGIVLPNRGHWITSILFNWIGWIAINIILEMALIEHFFFAMAMSTLLSWFAHLSRKKLVEKQIELLNERNLAIKHEHEAIAATEAKSLFLANMSHEIRTPMNGLIGMIDLVSRSKLSEEQKGFIATAKRSAESLMITINDVLDFSKIEAGELTIEQVEFDLEQLFSELIQDSLFQANVKGLQLELVKNNLQQKRVVGDPHRITQVMNNLLSNATKFTNSGSIFVQYDLIEHNKALQLNVAVTDTGIGISDTALPYLFESFSQADMSTTRFFGGTGLGLAITRQLCKLMGGDISVKSRLGEGSVFEFSILLQSQVPTITSNNKACAIQDLSNLSVLLVEDNPINQEVMIAILQNLKIEVVVANDGHNALDTLCHADPKNFDLIFMDCQMPNMDGYEATRCIREGKAGELARTIPIIALTASTMNSEREKCLDAGMNEYLTKPVDIDILKSILAKYQSN